MCRYLYPKIARCLVVIALPLALLWLVCLGSTTTPGYASPAALPDDGDRPDKINMSQDATAAVQPVAVDGGGGSVQSISAMIWQIQSLDSAGDVGQYTSLAISPLSESGPQLGISYYDATNGDLKYAVYNGTNWVTETVDSADDVGQYASLAFYTLVNRVYPRISYYDATNADLKYAYRDLSGWHIQVVDNDGIVGIHSSLQIAPTSPYTQSISYYDSTNGDLKYAYSTGSGWITQTVDTGDTASVGGNSSLELSPAAPHYPRISYYDSTNRDLKYASYNGISWTIETVDSGGAVGTYTSLSMSPTPPYTPHITYYDNPNANLKHAYYDGSAWISETVTSMGDTGQSSIVAQADGQLHVVYEDGNKLMLGYAHYDGSSWITETADSDYGVGSDPSLGIDLSGALHSAYYDWINGNLKYAWGSMCYGLSEVSLTGPTSGITGTTYVFTATVSPLMATSPFTFTWQATDRPDQVMTSTLTQSSIAHHWNTIGVKTITVTVSNCGNTVQATRAITLTSCREPLTGVSLSGPSLGVTGTQYFFNATVSPPSATPPFTYTWRVTEKPKSLVQTGSFTQTNISATWSLLGSQLVSVTVAHVCGSVTAMHPVTMVHPSLLPDLYMPFAWREGSKVYYALRNQGGSLAAAPYYTSSMYIDGVLQGYSVKRNLDLPGSKIPPITLNGSFGAPWGCDALTGTLTVCTDVGNRVAESDESNNCLQKVWACDAEAPFIISGPTVISRTQSAARIWWTTDEDSNGCVMYGKMSGSNIIACNYDLTKTHDIVLTSLAPGATYRYKVSSTDATGHRAESRELTFETVPLPPQPPQLTGLALTEAPDPAHIYGPSEFYRLEVTVANPADIKWVDLSMDDHIARRVMTATTSGLPIYEFYFNAASLGLSRAAFFAPHTLKAVAQGTTGLTATLTATVDLNYKPMLIDAQIIKPDLDKTIVITGTAAPAGTRIAVRGRAAQYEWGCVDSPGDYPHPPHTSHVHCSHIEQPVQAMSIFVDGAYKATYLTNPGEFEHQFSIDIGGLGLGNHTLEFMAIDNENYTRSVSQTFRVAEGPPQFSLERKVTREDNHLRVDLVLQNTGGAARVYYIGDTVVGLQPTVLYTRTLLPPSSVDRYYDVQIWDNGWYSDTNALRMDVKIFPGPDGKIEIAAGEVITFSYLVVPVLHEGEPPRLIGDLPVYLAYQPAIGGIWQTVAFNRSGNSVYDPDRPDGGGYWPLSVGLYYASKKADYVIVTNPRRLYDNDKYDDLGVTGLLDKMAQLAVLRNGALGYIYTYEDKNIVRKLYNAGPWAGSLHPDFRQTYKGYVLFVGEADVVASFHEKDFTVIWWRDGGVSFTPDDVNYSDLPYANTSGHRQPELVVGRIIGNDAAALTQPIQASIDEAMYPDLYFDRSHALLVSGRGDGVTDFIANINSVANTLSDEFSVTKLHWLNSTDYYGDLQALTPDQDIIGWNGHGNTDYWHPGLNSYTVSGLDFGSAHPFVFAASCLTGNYEAGDDYSIAEAFLKQGAGAYVGSTQVSEGGANSFSLKKFFQNWLPYHTPGYIVSATKRWVWSEDITYEFGRMWAHSYNFYGDPKYGVEPATLAQASAQAAAASPTLIQVHVPQYEVTPVEGWDYVDIPNGALLREQDDYRVPFWMASLDYAPGQRIQDVVLEARSGLAITTSLHIPTQTMTADCALYASGERAASLAAPSSRSAQDEEGWFPALETQYDWSVEQNTDGSSTLLLRLYPFYYHADSTDVLFFQDYTFTVQLITSTVAINYLDTDKITYRQGETILIDLGITNSGAEQNVVISAVIKDASSDKLVEGLPLSTLPAFTGEAVSALQWDSAGFAPDNYYVEVELRDNDGNLLDTQAREFTLGIVSGEVTSLTATPAIFDAGQPVNLLLVFSNTGSVPITGTAFIEVKISPTMSTTTVFTQAVANLAPGSSVQVDRVWNTAGATAVSYRVMAYVMHNSQVSGPRFIAVNQQTRLYLPLVLRNR